jgi:glutamine synthetase
MTSSDNSIRGVIDTIADRRPLAAGIDYVKEPISEIFGSNVFSDKVMKERLPKTVFKRLLLTIRDGEPLDASIADVVANAMKDWAMEKGATHYTHWFHPMTGSTAEKHDAFIDSSSDGGDVVTEFSGKMLIKGEPDASSFPSGGIRSTFEARGYTAWDPTSPAFIMENVNGRTLCIPTAFCSYTGEALDRKTPLLRSIEALSKQALRVLRLFGNTASYVRTTLGAEQEYFLIDKKFYLRRPDLINAGRTLYGSRPPKGQEMEDHYFGTIRPRILAFMMDCERKLYRLGIPVKTRHNEVSPAQFEIAPVFENANVATDHNMVVMETLRSTADEHGLVCLLHEKPFAGVNGSGKHNNWSMCDSEGTNLLEPGDTPHENAQFLVFLAAILRAVHKNPEILRIGVAGAGNDYRLGANEAPPAILSIYLGEQLTEVMENIIEGKKLRGKHGGTMQVGVTALPPLPKDATDRNRTSPFAFTGNKFEFRAVGSSQSIAPANIAINVAVASALDDVATDIEGRIKGGASLNDAVQAVLQNLFPEHRPIVFNGDNYSKEWPVEAERRGLPNLRNSVDALARFIDPEIIKVFVKYGVLSKREILSRQEILLENYSTTLSIEAQIAASMGRTMILPAAIAYQKKIADSVVSLRAALGANADVSAQKNLLEVLTTHINRLKRALSALDEARSKADEAHGSAFKRAKLYRDAVLPIMQECRESADMLEHYVEDSMWPMPKYREMLWIY